MGLSSCQAPSLWERACPRSRRRGGWHRLRRCSRACPLPHRPCRLQGPGAKLLPLQAWGHLVPSAIPVGAGVPAKQATRWMAPAAPVFAGLPAPTPCRLQGEQSYCRYRHGAILVPSAIPVGAGVPAKQATRWMAPAAPMFAGLPAPTPTAQASRSWSKAIAATGMGLSSCQAPSLWERACPRSRRRGGWHRLRRCSRACPLPHRPCRLQGEQSYCCYRHGVSPVSGAIPVGAGVPAKRATRWMAPAAPVFAGRPAPTGVEQAIGFRARQLHPQGQSACQFSVDTGYAATPLSSHIHATGFPACPCPTTPFPLRVSLPRQARALPLPRNPRNSRSSDRGALSRQVG